MRHTPVRLLETPPCEAKTTPARRGCPCCIRAPTFLPARFFPISPRTGSGPANISVTGGSLPCGSSYNNCTCSDPASHSIPDHLRIPSQLRYMTPMPVSRTSTESVADPTDRPERSRNAKAQARHRAKRKAYIEQLETTVTKLQVALALSPEQVAALPAPVIRIRELEEENELLHRELGELRRQLEDRNARLRPDLGRRHGTISTSPYDRSDYESRRRRLTESQVYLQAQNGHTHSPPPPLLIPSSTSPQTQPSSQVGIYPRMTSSSTLTSYGMYQMPGTPSSSSTSTASNSPFSPCDYTPPSTLHSHHRPTSSTNSSSLLAAYGQAPGQYEYVKVEEDSYHGHTLSHTNGYSASLPSFAGSQSSLNHWQTYSTQRP
ncbi:uncharacterized protein C8Q71DRAFT_791107 [Rhodofomes roseus]|uniref:BZIP domain-containing protein n=1 Tax=Rhodofomes roseus TaxID=34475 RepID=A0ABQ8JY66_9APHY|nr:uncharacterized protein C8Q71DRAFT_791107 [Rhodofomes roseus]KAH9829217.1 hypothetical protein C8Q71DRAFT_791107 [Rhodofomes roseus]